MHKIDWILKNEDLTEIGRITLKSEPDRTLWFRKILPDLDYEIAGGTWKNPKWAWEEHPWFTELRLSKEECETYLQSGGMIKY